MTEPSLSDKPLPDDAPPDAATTGDAPSPVAVPPPVPTRERRDFSSRRLANVVVRALSITSLSLSLLASVMFFAPWMSERHRGLELEQSGYQLATGTIHHVPADSAEEKIRAEQLRTEVNKGLHAFPAAWIFLGGLLTVALFSVAHFVLAGSYRPVFSLLGSALAAVVMVTLLVVQVPLEKRFELGEIRTAVFYLSCVLTFLVLVTTIAHYTLAAVLQYRQSRRSAVSSGSGRGSAARRDTV